MNLIAFISCVINMNINMNVIAFMSCFMNTNLDLNVIASKKILQVLRNEDQFGPITNSTIVIVIQVHNRLVYLRLYHAVVTVIVTFVIVIVIQVLN